MAQNVDVGGEMTDQYYEAVLPIPRIVDLVNKAGALLLKKRAQILPGDVDKVLWYLGQARTGLDGEISDWAHVISEP